VKKYMFLITVAILGIALFAQEITHETLVINIEVPVRVFKGEKFVEDLTIDDFEVFEDGKIQKIEAVYLIKKTSIEKKEGEKIFSPNVSRNFVLLFQVQDYLPKIEKALDYFFNNVIMPGDALTVFTPMKTYNFKTEALSLLPREEIVKQLKAKIRKDTLMGNSEYKHLLREMQEQVAGVDEMSIQIVQLLLNRLVMGFAEFLKAKEGQKYVFLFYQKELLPQLDPTTLSTRQSLSQDEQHFLFQLSDLFLHYRRDIAFNVDRIKQVFSDSSISIHFLYITKAPVLSVEGMQPSPVTWREQSEDIFSAFREMAMATGGLTDSSSNAASSFQRVVDASENYYLIYYAPKGYKRDGTFRNIDVKVKNKNYRISHRAGYFAN